jgi:hypothetical protein
VLFGKRTSLTASKSHDDLSLLSQSFTGTPESVADAESPLSTALIYNTEQEHEKRERKSESGAHKWDQDKPVIVISLGTPTKVPVQISTLFRSELTNCGFSSTSQNYYPCPISSAST